MHRYNPQQLEELQSALLSPHSGQGPDQGQNSRGVSAHPAAAAHSVGSTEVKVPYPRVVEVLRSGRFDLSDAEITQVGR